MKTGIVSAFGVLLSCVGAWALPLTGTYQTIDDASNLPKSVVVLYEYDNDGHAQLAGRIVALYGADGKISETIAKPAKIAEKVSGKPNFVGLDIVWGMDWDSDDTKFEDGKIMDPQSGKVYSSVIWQDTPGELNVRGKIGPFGRTQVWRSLTADALPADLQNLDIKNWKPLIRK